MKESGGELVLAVTLTDTLQQQLVLHVDRWGTPTVMVLGTLDGGVGQSGQRSHFVVEMKRDLSSVHILAGETPSVLPVLTLVSDVEVSVCKV